jgi:hypothetical protein
MHHQTMNATSNRPNLGLPPSIVRKAERAAKVSGKPVTEFLKLYLVECMREENEAVEPTQPKKPAA